jgi:hypothetical protein
MVQAWYLLIDIHVILIYVELEYGLFISVLEKRATGYKFWSWKSIKCLKRQIPLNSNTAHFQTLVCILPGFGAPKHVRVYEVTGECSKEKSHEDGLK